MATPIIKSNSIVAAVKETTEGTYAAPASATDGYIQPLKDGFSATPSIEKISRNILIASIGEITPRNGQKTVAGSLPVEMRASGLEGGDVDFAVLLESLLGAKRSIATTSTTKTGNTASVLQIEDADISKYAVGDFIVVKESGAYHGGVITAVDTTVTAANITITPAASGAFSDNVVVSKAQTYYPANTGHPSFSASYYWANEITQKAIGCKVTSMSVDNFSVGQLASFNFAFDGLSFDEVDGGAAHTPTYDTGLPPIILKACLYQDGTEITVNNFSLSVTNTLAFQTGTCSENGRLSSRVSARSLTGSFNPYKDDTSVAQYTKFNANTEFSFHVIAYNPSTTAGEWDMGSVVSIYLPNCTITEKNVGDADGLLVEELAFRADKGSAGASNEIYLGFV